MKTQIVLKEIFFVLIVVGLLAAALVVDRQFYLMRQVASAQFGNFQVGHGRFHHGIDLVDGDTPARWLVFFFALSDPWTAGCV